MKPEDSLSLHLGCICHHDFRAASVKYNTGTHSNDARRYTNLLHGNLEIHQKQQQQQQTQSQCLGQNRGERRYAWNFLLPMDLVLQTHFTNNQDKLSGDESHPEKWWMSKTVSYLSQWIRVEVPSLVHIFFFYHMNERIIKILWNLDDL